MRKFGAEARQYFEFQLEGSDKVYQIPLAASMPASTLLMLQNADRRGDGFEGQMEMLRRYMGDDAEELTAGTASQILEAWALESTNQGASVGES